MSEKTVEILARLFLDYAKAGIILNTDDLMILAKKRRLKATREEIREMKYLFTFSTYFLKFKKPLRFPSLLIPKYGVIQLGKFLLFNGIWLLISAPSP